MDGWKKGWIDRFNYRQMDRWIDGTIDRSIDINRWTDRHMDTYRYMDGFSGQMHGWIDRTLDRWIDR